MSEDQLRCQYPRPPPPLPSHPYPPQPSFPQKPNDAGETSVGTEGVPDLHSPATKDITAHVHQLQQYRLYGWWKESRDLSSSLTPEEILHPEVAIQIGRNFFEQGYVKMALDAVNSSYCRWKNLWHDQTAMMALRLARAYFQTFCQQDLKGALQEALETRNVESNLDVIEAPSDTEVSSP